MPGTSKQIEMNLEKAGSDAGPSTRNDERGFSLIEVAVAMVVVLIALLGVFMTLTYAISWNAGNNSRSQALAILQEEVERIRSYKFTPYFTDEGLRGGIRPTRTVTSPNGGVFSVRVQVDNDPATDGIQTETDVPVPTLKEVEINVRLENPSPGWQTAIPATIVMRRVRSN